MKSKKAELQGSPESLLKRSVAFSTGEKILICVALDIWSESGNARINELEYLDSGCFKNVILGPLIARGFQPA